MSKRKFDDSYKARLFYILQSFFYSLAKNEYANYNKYIEEAVLSGIINLNKSIVDNVDTFIKSASSEIKTSQDFKEGLNRFNSMLKELEPEMMDKFHNKKLINFILEFKLVPYEQVDVTRMYFNNPNMSNEEKLDFLHQEINAILNDAFDFRIINSLDKIGIDSVILKQDIEYQNFMEYLVNKYVVDYDKKEKNIFNDEIIRLIYRHQNRGYYKATDNSRNEIVYTHAYNLWFKNLKFMIQNNKIGITLENYELIYKYIIQAIEDRRIDSEMSWGEYVLIYEKVNEILDSLVLAANESMKLVRKGEK